MEQKDLSPRELRKAYEKPVLSEYGTVASLTASGGTAMPEAAPLTGMIVST